MNLPRGFIEASGCNRCVKSDGIPPSTHTSRSAHYWIQRTALIDVGSIFRCCNPGGASDVCGSLCRLGLPMGSILGRRATFLRSRILKNPERSSRTGRISTPLPLMCAACRYLFAESGRSAPPKTESCNAYRATI